LRTNIPSSYRGHYRRAVLDLLAAPNFRSRNDAHRQVIQALDLVRHYTGTMLRPTPPTRPCLSMASYARSGATPRWTMTPRGARA
jgi:hypothetical protein